jgi:hypothetical protein
MTEKALTAQRPGRVDRAALRVNQASIIALLTIAFVLALPWLVLLVGLVMAIGTAEPRLALFQRLYSNVLRPAGWLRPEIVEESAAPHRFAQGMGGVVLLLATGALYGGAPVAGWILAIVVIALAAVNLLFGFCAGCFIYFQLQRLRG